MGEDRMTEPSVIGPDSGCSVMDSTVQNVFTDLVSVKKWPEVQVRTHSDLACQYLIGRHAQEGPWEIILPMPADGLSMERIDELFLAFRHPPRINLAIVNPDSTLIYQTLHAGLAV
eukprot:comp20038_c0_seq1/m.24603 comp20038_c0_seq1/g.24603  ORF comp20038_c0_seq1/g.24603 comp20038_c0_seq1/m.24603 type:complete len:116 (-) comp20038_c0_seq1:293-640(-)